VGKENGMKKGGKMQGWQGHGTGCLSGLLCCWC